MTSFKVVHSEAEDWVHAARICAEEFCDSDGIYTLGFIYVTDNLDINIHSKALMYLDPDYKYDVGN